MLRMCAQRRARLAQRRVSFPFLKRWQQRTALVCGPQMRKGLSSRGLEREEKFGLDTPDAVAVTRIRAEVVAATAQSTNHYTITGC